MIFLTGFIIKMWTQGREKRFIRKNKLLIRLQTVIFYKLQRLKQKVNKILNLSKFNPNEIDNM